MWFNLILILSGIFIISFVVCLALIRVSKNGSLFIDHAHNNKPQRFHTSNTSRAGGLGIFAAFMIGMFVFFLPFFDAYILEFFEHFGFAIPSHFGQVLLPFFELDSESFGAVFRIQILWICAGCSVIFLSGLAEDFSSSISPKLRLIMQCSGAFVVCYFTQIYIFDLNIGFLLPYWLALMFSIFALVGVANAINIIDGFNGLAGGVCVLIFGAVAFVAIENGDFFAFSVSILVVVAILGFFVLNFPKGKIFLGDGGAYFLGFLAGLLLVEITQGRNDVSAWFGLAVMIYPVWEVLFSILRRKKGRKNAMEPDSLHLHTLIFAYFASKHTKKLHIKTSLSIWIFNLPFVIFAVIFAHSTPFLIASSLVFMGVYVVLYKKLSIIKTANS